MIKKLLNLLPPGDKLKLALLILLMLIGAALEVIGIGMLPAFVAIVATPERVLEIERLAAIWELLDIRGGGDLLLYGAILLIAVFFIKNTYLIAYYYIETRFIHNRYGRISSRLYEVYMRAPYVFHLKRNTSELLRNVTQETSYLLKRVMTPLLKIVKDAVLISAIFLFLVYIEPVITLGAMLFLGGSGFLFMRILKKKIRYYGKQAQQDRRNMIQDVNEGLGGFKDVTVLNRQDTFISRFTTHVKRYAKSQVFRTLANKSTKPVMETIAVSGMLFIAVMLYIQGRGLEVVVPILTLFGAATIRLMPAIQEMVKAINDLRYYKFSVDPIHRDIRDLEPERHFRKQKEEKPLVFNDTLTCDNVGYSYPDSEKTAVQKLSLTIPKGSVVGFVGASGAGKTTLVDMLLGLLEPQQGIILVDGKVNIYENTSAWQKKVGYIPQFIYLCDDSLRANIAFGVPENEVNEDQLKDAIKAAQLTELVERLSNGMDTVIGERGVLLSGGQRQRIGIARALYHNPEVLIMDEATSALDNVTEKYVIEAIERLRGERTIIMIAHRLTTVQNCDTLFIMKDGMLQDSGTYEELIKNNVGFKQLALTE